MGPRLSHDADLVEPHSARNATSTPPEVCAAMAAPRQLHRRVSSTSSPESTASSRHHCDKCPSSFVRLEHLKRHQRDHWATKPFACLLCGKAFTRSDTLQRHETVHAAMAQTDAGRTQTRSRKGPRIRACRNCAQARARCSGRERVCARCDAKALACEYPEKRRRSEEVPSPAHRHRDSWTIAQATAFPTHDLPDDIAAAAQPVRSAQTALAQDPFLPQVSGAMMMDLDTVFEPCLDPIAWPSDEHLDYAVFGTRTQTTCSK